MEISITKIELLKALAEIEAAEKNGFYFCEGVFSIREMNGSIGVAYYSDLWEKAHPTNGSLNWGRFQDVHKRKKFDGEKLVPLNLDN